MSIRTGDVGELSFMLRSTIEGLNCFNSFSSDCVYDVAIDNGKTLHRIQVKSSTALSPRKDGSQVFCFSAARGASSKRKYEGNDFDYFAFYIIPLDLFYIIPINVITSVKVRLYPERDDHVFSKYRERWDLLK